MPKDINPQEFETAVRIGLAIDKIIFDPAISKQLVAMMQGQPANALARAAVTVLKALQEKSKGQPQRGFAGFIPQIVQRLSELAEAAKLFKATPQILEQAAAMVAQQPQQQAAQPQQNEQPQPQAAQPRGLIGATMQGA